MERLMKPSTVAAITWLKDRLVSMQVPKSRSMIEKAIEDMQYRIEKYPDSRYDQSQHEYVPVCPTCGEELEEYECEYCPNCGQAIEWGDEA